ncbi:hypothetical protein [Promicromonospora panici]|uniref:ApeA N-terminal domain 1-containing protein n=1 Tax=Promicromonospora panici TaxID=2219658 RepID=UPI00101D8555|nr:hypothetical protein [Promicromonospora panici]
MVIEYMKSGQALAGLLVDGVEGTPYVGATLTLDKARGVLIEVPFLTWDETGQFTHVREWFDSRTPPTNLLFQSVEGPISLFDLRWDGHSLPGGLTAARGTIQAGETVLSHRDGALADPLEVEQIRSWLDRLNDWTGLTSVSADLASEPDGRISRARSYTVNVQSAEPVTWEQGEATLTLESVWRSSQEDDDRGRRHLIADDVVLDSSFPQPRPFLDHLVEQRKVANLLVLLYGSRIAFRRHRLRDQRFVDRFANGEVIDTPFVDLVSTRTVRDGSLPMPDHKERPIAYLAQIGHDGLETWAENYKRWKRFILPAVNAFGRPGVLVEETVMSTFTSLEAASREIGPREGESTTYNGRGMPTTATHAYRCIHVLDISWPEQIAATEGLARAIADNYNTIKHADRGNLPDARKSILVSHINRWIIRLLALHLTGKDGTLLTEYRNDPRELWTLQQTFEAYQLSIAADGTWHTNTPI